ncbi:head maturation protease, ClpP-related [Flammeovirga aprica]|uniref:ATP-dependent Clp protease proteolytic subunit n=1 Tax=Flammeovirga aprica JL-4 TaxID=694437 RepID=A0A7X9X9P9_9BACT|nr:head maturation protease, ClpP-related [Flammeovirga aprica]NME69012.1 hypothetical protein [Flammeovirga aprica JL-4]
MSKNELPLNRVIAKSASEVDWILFGSVGGWGNLNATVFVLSLAELGNKYKRINLRVHSPGGIVYEGLRIFNAIRASKAEIHIYIEGISASMMTYIQTAVPQERVHIAKNARLMTHQVRGGARGSANDLREVAKEIDDLNNIILNQYAEYTGKDKKEIQKKWMRDGKDTWFSAQEAVDANMAGDIYDGRVGSKLMATACFDEDDFDLDAFSNQVMEEIEPITETEKNENTMNKELAKALGLSENATDEQILEAVNTLVNWKQTAIASLMSLGEKLQEVDDSNRASMEKFASVDFEETMNIVASAFEVSEHNEEQHEDLVNAYIALGKEKGLVTEKNEASYTKLANVDPESFFKLVNEHKAEKSSGGDSERVSEIIKKHKASKEEDPKPKDTPPNAVGVPDLDGEEEVSIEQMSAYFKLQAMKKRK